VLLAGLLTALSAGSVSIAYGWAVLWVVVLTEVLMGYGNLSSTIVMVLLGRLIGLLTRYFLGYKSQKATGSALISGIKMAGIKPKAVVRMDNRETYPLAYRDFLRSFYSPLSAASYGSGGGGTAPRSAAAFGSTSTGSPTNSAPTATSGENPRRTPTGGKNRYSSRDYVVWDKDGKRYIAYVYDTDAQASKTLSSFWNSFKIRGTMSHPFFTVQQTVEKVSLLGYAVEAAGVRCNKVVGVATRGDSMIFLTDFDENTIPVDYAFEELDADPSMLAAMFTGAERGGVSVDDAPLNERGVSDAPVDETSITQAAAVSVPRTPPIQHLRSRLMRSAFEQLKLAHKRGIVHGNLTADNVRFNVERQAVLKDWSSGALASGNLEKRIDIVQLIMLFAVFCPTKAVVSTAMKVFGRSRVLEIVPYIQVIALPASTKRALKKGALKEVREEVMSHAHPAKKRPHQDVPNFEPIALARISLKNTVILLFLLFAIYVLLATLNLDEFVVALREAHWEWVIVALAASILTYFGSSASLMGFSAPKITLKEALLTTFAMSFFSLVAPSGTGVIALQARLLKKKKEPAAAIATTIALIQVSLFACTLAVLAAFCVIGGNLNALQGKANMQIVLIVLVILLVLASLMFVPKLGKYIQRKIREYIRQVGPRIVWVLGQKKKLAMGLGGNTLCILSYIICFWCSTKAFGINVDIASLAIVYYLANTAGSIVPTPGGIGSVELALTGALTTLHIPAAAAASAALLYRVVTFWLMIFVGYICWRMINKRSTLPTA
jgi:uncharacterized protein (TIRG00374 family)